MIWTGEKGHGHGGVIVSPGYPMTYPANIECNWLIRVSRNKRVYVKLLELELASSRGMVTGTGDFLEILKDVG